MNYVQERLIVYGDEMRNTIISFFLRQNALTGESRVCKENEPSRPKPVRQYYECVVPRSVFLLLARD